MRYALSWMVYASVMTAAVSFYTAQCPATKKLTAEFALIADAIAPESVTTFNSTTGLHFLRNIMLFTEEEIAQATQDVIQFFNTSFGLDFSQATPDENGRWILADIGAMFTIWEFSPKVNYHLIVNNWSTTGSKLSFCFDNRGGGFGATFKKPLTLNGTYGGEDGKPVVPGDFVLYGFYNIPLHTEVSVVCIYKCSFNRMSSTYIIICNKADHSH